MRERVRTVGRHRQKTRQDFHGKLLQFSFPASTQGYQRYASSPPAPQPSQHFPHASAYPQFSHQPSPLVPLQNQSAPTHGIPDFSAWGIDGATAQFGMQLGQNAVAAGQSYVQRNVLLLFSSCFNPALTIFLFNSTRRSVDSYQSLISSTTSTFQIHMSSASCVSSSSLGGINHGRAKCVGQRPEAA